MNEHCKKCIDQKKQILYSQSWARDNKTMFQAKQLFFVVLLLVTDALTRCRCRKAKTLSLAQLCLNGPALALTSPSVALLTICVWLIQLSFSTEQSWPSSCFTQLWLVSDQILITASALPVASSLKTDIYLCYSNGFNGQGPMTNGDVAAHC